MSNGEMVTLGDHTIEVYAQRHAYLTNGISKYISGLVDSDADLTDGAAVLALLGDKVYDLLCLAVPTFRAKVPQYEFMGYASKEAFEAGEYDPDADHSPTTPEILGAFETAARVNRFDAVKVVGKFIDPNLARTWVSTQMANAIMNESQSSPAVKVGSETSTPTTTIDPTSTENAVSPSDESKSSSPPTSGEST